MEVHFNSQGLLTPAKPIALSIADVEQIFVTSEDRHRLFVAYRHFVEELMRQTRIDTFTQWLDGSYVTKAPRPNDIDVVTFLKYEQYERAETALAAFTNVAYHRRTSIDCYFVKVYPEGHPMRICYESDRQYWFHQFSRVRRKVIGEQRVEKGFVELTF